LLLVSVTKDLSLQHAQRPLHLADLVLASVAEGQVVCGEAFGATTTVPSAPSVDIGHRSEIGAPEWTYLR
jgi:hypothetical protein